MTPFHRNIHENVVGKPVYRCAQLRHLQKFNKIILSCRFKAILLHPQHWKGLRIEK